MSITKKELVHAISLHTGGFGKSNVEQVLDQLAATAHEQIAQGEDFLIPGIGKLSTSAREARIGRNPRTGEALEIPAKTVVKFSAAKALKDAAA